jgi:hypothetical protein
MNNSPSGPSVSPEALFSKLANAENKSKYSVENAIVTINEI